MSQSLPSPRLFALLAVSTSWFSPRPGALRYSPRRYELAQWGPEQVVTEALREEDVPNTGNKRIEESTKHLKIKGKNKKTLLQRYGVDLWFSKPYYSLETGNYFFNGFFMFFLWCRKIWKYVFFMFGLPWYLDTMIFYVFLMFFFMFSIPPDPPDQTNRVQYASQACKKDVRGPAFPLS